MGACSLPFRRLWPRTARSARSNRSLEQVGIDPDAVTMVRQSTVRPIERERASRWTVELRQNSLVWAEAIETARENAVSSPRYALLMLTAGVIATFGIILRNPILIVGAMATSPDLLPLSAFCIGVVGKRPKLALRGVAILVIGMLIAGLTAWALSWVMLHAGTYNGVLSSTTACCLRGTRSPGSSRASVSTPSSWR